MPTALVAVAGDGVAGPPVAADAAAATASGVRVARRRSCTAGSPTRRVVAVPFLWLSLLPLALWRIARASGPQGARPHRAGVGGIGRRRASGSSRVVARPPPPRAARRRRRGRSSRRCAPRWSRAARVARRRAGRRRAGVHPRGDLRFFAGGGAWLVLGGARRLGRGLPRAAGLAGARRRGAAAAARRPSRSCGRMPRTGSAHSGSTRSGPPIPFAAVIAVLGSLVAVGAVARDRPAVGPRAAARRARRLVRRHARHRAIRCCASPAAWSGRSRRRCSPRSRRGGRRRSSRICCCRGSSTPARSRIDRGSAAGAASLLLAAVVASRAVARARARRALGGRDRARASCCAPAAASRGSIWTVDPGAGARRAAGLVRRCATARCGGCSPTRACRGRARRSARMPPAARCSPPASRPPTWPAGRRCCPTGPTWWVPLLSAPLALLALVAPLTQRWAAGIAMLVIAGARDRDGVRGGRASAVSFAQSIAGAALAGHGPEPRVARRARRRARRARRRPRAAAAARPGARGGRGVRRASPCSRCPR